MRSDISYAGAHRKLAGRGRQILMSALSLAVTASIAGARSAPATDSSAVVAEVGTHKITEQQVDAKLKLQLYNARKAVIDRMVDDYLVQQAAEREKLSVAAYLKREIDDKAAADVNEAAARKFYDQNKDKLPGLKAAGSFDKIKDRLIAALRQQAQQQKRAELLASLRKQADVKVLLEPPRVEVASGGHPALGPGNAPVTIVEFGDFQCPFCRAAESSVKAVRHKYGDHVQLVYVDFPLSFHNNAMHAANAARCAGEQGKFWQYHDALFADQAKLAPADLKATAKKLGLETAKFDICLSQGRYDNAISRDVALGHKLNVTGTPTFFIDGRLLEGAQPEASFIEVIDEELAAAHSKPEQARIETKGKVAARVGGSSS
jgi:protein-disulfide isomerase